MDAGGAWLASWRGRHERCGAGHLRSPVTQCAHAAPGALSAYCARRGREQARPVKLACMLPKHSRRPAPAVCICC